MRKRVVITGIGVIASNGIGRDAFWEAIFKGVSGIKPISLFDTAGFSAKTAGEVKDFQPQDFLGQKGLRTLDRSTKLAACSAFLALRDAKIEIDEPGASSVGVALGCTLGSLSSICDFDKVALTDGPQYVNPALFPNTVFNSPASEISIKLGIRGFNATIATGFSASLDALKYAWDCINAGRATTVVAGGVEELCAQTFLGFSKAGCLAQTKGGVVEASRPFDKRRNGVVFGEGACMLALEDLSSALSRNAHIYAELSGVGMSFDPYGINAYNPKGEGLYASMSIALSNACVNTGDVDYICAGANSSKAADAIEAQAIGRLFHNESAGVGVSAVKSMIGECFSAGGALQVAAAMGAIARQSVPPTINFAEKDPDCDVALTACAVNRPVDLALVNAFGPSGCNTSVLVKRYTA